MLTGIFRRRPILSTLFGLVLSFAVFVMTQWIDRWRADRAVATEIARLDSSDPGWTFDAIDARRKAIAPDENGALRVIELAALIPKDWPVWNKVQRPIADFLPPEEAPPPDPVEVVHKQLRELDLDASDALDPRTMQIILGELKRAAPTLKLAESLEQFESGRFPLNLELVWPRTLVPDSLKGREVAHLLRWDALAMSQGGDAEGICRRALQIAHVGGAYGDDYFLIGQLTRIALMSQAVATMEHGLSIGQANPETLRRLQRKFQQEEKELPRLLLHAARAERALTHRMMEALFDGNISLQQFADAGWRPQSEWQRFVSYFGLGHLRWHHAAFLRECSDELEQWPSAWDSNAPILGPICPETGDLWYKNYISGLSKFKRVQPRQQTVLRCAVAAAACEQFRMAHQRWPKAWIELTPQLLKEVLHDPFGNGKLTLLQKGDSLVIYSVGYDGVDNGGIIEAGNPMRDGTDFGFVLFDPRDRGIKKK